MVNIKTLKKLEKMAEVRGITQNEFNEIFDKYDGDVKKIIAEIKKKGNVTTSNVEMNEVEGIVLGFSGKRLTNEYDVKNAIEQEGKLYKVGKDGKIVKDNSGKPVEVKERFEYIGYALVDGEVVQLRMYKEPEINVPCKAKIRYPKPKDDKRYSIIFAKELEEIPEPFDYVDVIEKVETLDNPIDDYAIYDLEFIMIKENQTRDGRKFKQALFVGKNEEQDTIWVTSEPFEDLEKTNFVAGKLKVKERNGRTYYTIYQPVTLKL